MTELSQRRITLLETIIALTSGVFMAYRCGQISSGSVPKFSWKSDVSHFNEESVARNAPFIQSEKESPYRKYTSRIFRNSLINMSSVHLDQEEVCEENEDGTYVCEFEHRPNGPIEEEKITLNVNNDDDDAHLPAGQHLLIDIKNVNSDFLSSEVRLAQAMIDVVNESQLTLLSYHCHRLLPIGVSCVGVLLESHISFHTWPLDGVISLDLFTCGSGLLVPVIPLIEKLFALPREMVSEDDHLEKPIVLWVSITFVYFYLVFVLMVSNFLTVTQTPWVRRERPLRTASG
jgi:S-adenosylmethionine decarboxylase proenzyme